MQNGADARVTVGGVYINVTVTSQIKVATVRVLCDEVKFCDGPET